MARPKKWEDRFVALAEKAAKLGATDREIAELMEISERTLNYWKQDHCDLVEALRVGKETADARVEQSLYRRALGYTHDAVKIHTVDGEVVITPFVERYPPDTTAAIFWLKNRKPEEWRDKTEQDLTIKGDLADIIADRRRQVAEGRE